MEKDIVVAASFYKHARFFNERYSGIPTAVREELVALCALTAEEVRGVVTMGFYGNGAIFIEADGAADDFDYDEIGARMVIDRVTEEKSELFRALQLWYVAFMTDEGKGILQESALDED